jgi:hypothetical protein
LDAPWIDLLREVCETAQDNPGEFAEYLQKPTDEGVEILLVDHVFVLLYIQKSELK